MLALGISLWQEYMLAGAYGRQFGGWVWFLAILIAALLMAASNRRESR